jgi:hypothetical protein
MGPKGIIFPSWLRAVAQFVDDSTTGTEIVGSNPATGGCTINLFTAIINSVAKKASVFVKSSQK